MTLGYPNMIAMYDFKGLEDSLTGITNNKRGIGNFD
jgi:hypothetical protein